MEKILFITMILALLGAYLNSIGKKEGFLVWILTNSIFMMHNYLIGQWQQALLFACYLFLAAFGLYNQLKQEKLKNEKKQSDDLRWNEK